jgi:hypothetical protein
MIDLDKLNDSQRRIAEKIIATATEQGVDPQLALAVAKVESGFSQAAKGSSGEIGVMQLMPATAKSLGVNPKSLDENIFGGVTYLKQMLDLTGGDVRKALVGYNGGPGLAKMENPPNMGYADKVNEVYPFDAVGQARRLKQQVEGGVIPVKQEVQESQETELPESDAASEARRLAQQIDQMQINYPDDPAIGRAMSAAAGAPAGGLLSGAGEVVKRGMQQKRFNAFQEAQRAARDQNLARVAQGMTPGEKWASKVTGYVKPGVETVSEAATDYRRAMPQGKISGRMARLYGIPGPDEPAQLSQRLIDRAKNAPVMGEVRQGLPTQQPTQQPTRPGGKISGLFKGSTLGALGGAGAGYSAYDAYDRYMQGDVPGAALSAIGALGGAASLAPHPVARGVGLATTAAVPFLADLYDRYKPQRTITLPE